MQKILMTIAFAALVSVNVSAEVSAEKSAEYQNPTHEQMKAGRDDYLRYCASCHGKDGQGDTGPKLIGSAIATGPMGKHVHHVIAKQHTIMPSWGLSELSDDAFAQIITYQRNSWGNGDKKAHGDHAGGVVSPEMVKKHRKTLDAQPAPQPIDTHS